MTVVSIKLKKKAIELNNCLKNHLWIIPFIIFLISVLTRSYLAIIYGEISVFNDEFLHWKTSQSLWYTGKVIIRGLPSTNNDLLYAIVISICHIFGHIDVSYVAVKILNSLLMSSVAFPIYLVSKIYTKSRLISALICILALINPELGYTARILQENLYFPMFMWLLYYLVLLFHQKNISNKQIIKLSIIMFFMTLCKQVALCTVVSFIVWLACNKDESQRCLYKIFIFVITFMLLYGIYIILFPIYNGGINDFNDSNSSIPLITVVNNIFKNIASFKLFVRPIFTYVCIVLIIFNFFPIVLPFIFWGNLNTAEKKLYFFCIIDIFITICTAVILYYIRENLGDEVIRIHYRYIFYLFVPIMILFYNIFKKIKFEKKSKLKLLALTVIYFAIILSVRTIVDQSCTIDAPSSFFLNYGYLNENELKILIILVIMFLILLFIYKKARTAYILITLNLISIGIYNNVFVYNDLFHHKRRDAEYNTNVQYINEYLNYNLRQDDICIIITDYNWQFNTRKTEANLNIPYYMMEYENISTNMNGIIDYENSFLTNGRGEPISASVIDKIDYIIMLKDVKTELFGYDLVINTSTHLLYKRSDEHSGIQRIISASGWYSDKWVGKSSYFKIFYPTADTELEIYFKIDTPNFSEIVVNCSDNVGELEPLHISKNKDIYRINLRKNEVDLFFQLHMVSEKIFVPQTEDNRELSFRVLNIELSNPLKELK